VKPSPGSQDITGLPGSGTRHPAPGPASNFSRHNNIPGISFYKYIFIPFLPCVELFRKRLLETRAEKARRLHVAPEGELRAVQEGPVGLRREEEDRAGRGGLRVLRALRTQPRRSGEEARDEGLGLILPCAGVPAALFIPISFFLASAPHIASLRLCLWVSSLAAACSEAKMSPKTSNHVDD
jgi:hypothetical protein